MKHVTIGSAELYLADCRDVLPGLSHVDAVIADPPYEEEAHTNSRRLLGKGQDGGRGRKVGVLPIGFDKMDEELRAATAAEISRICRGWSLVFCQVEGVHLWRSAFPQGKYMRTAIWVKPDGAPQFTGDRPGMGYESILVHWHGEGRSRWNGGGRHGVFTHSKSDEGYGHGGTQNEHPTKKPQRLMKDLVQLFSDPGHLVLDPFMGCGSTGVACAQMGRRFIGIERDPKHFESACARIREVARQPDFLLEAGIPW